jgi:hypothetical protein
MKRQIRLGVFETNSSSMHSLVMMSKEDFEKFKNGEMFWYEDEILSKEQIIERIKENYPEGKNLDYLFKIANEEYDESEDDDTEDSTEEEDLDNEILYDLRTYENYNKDYETFYEEFKTKNGETVVSLGYYGMDN